MNKLLDLLSAEDKKKIEGYIKRFASCTGHLDPDRIDLDHILRFWDTEKMDLFQLLGEKFIAEKEFKYNESINDIEDKMHSIVYSSEESPCRTFIRRYKNLPNVHSLTWDSAAGILNLIDPSTLAKNVYDNFQREITLPDGKILKVNRGCKPIKTIAKIAKAFGIEEGFEEFRIAHSMALNQKALTGKMCLSIHPLDFMTMSDNDNDWSSCMSWKEEGCYRQGTVEMMNSPMVVVAYLASDQPMTLYDDKKWNSKKWRELFIINRDVITNIKSYPYKNEELTEAALTWIKELAEKNISNSYEEDIIHWNNEDRDKDDDIFEERHLRIRFSSNKMYNDFQAKARQSTYIGKNVKDGSFLSFNYSGKCECMFCGGKFDFNTDLDDAEKHLCCMECEGYITCEWCENLIKPDCDDYFNIDGVCLCENCYENHTCETPFDGETHLSDDCEPIYLAYDEGAPVEGRKCYPVWWMNGDGQIKEDDKTVIKTAALLYTKDIERTAKTYIKNGEFEILTDRYNAEYYVIRFGNVTEAFAEDIGFDSVEELIEAFKQKREIKLSV